MSENPLAVCSGCGCTDATLRIAEFSKVTCLLIVSRRSSKRGIYCERCRRREMSDAKIHTALFGWWGLGLRQLIWSAKTLTSPKEGVMDRDANAKYLAWLGSYFYQTGRYVEALAVWQACVGFRPNSEIDAAIEKLAAAILEREA